MMKKLLASLGLCGIFILSASGQSSISEIPRPRRAAPQLIGAKRPTYTDVIGTTSTGEEVIFRIGEDIPLELVAGTPLHLVLDSPLRTNKMKEGVPVIRQLPVKGVIESFYGQLYANKNYLVLTEFSGRASGLKSRAVLEVVPTVFQVEVRPTDYLIASWEDQHYVFLKPGMWRFDLLCSLREIVTPYGDTWRASSNLESSEVKGERFGMESKEQNGSDYYGLTSFPHGDVAFGITQLKGLWKYFVHRPNIILPASTDLYFRIDHMTATYLGPPIPMGEAEMQKAVDNYKP
jgi:hypothetical protein